MRNERDCKLRPFCYFYTTMLKALKNRKLLFYAILIGCMMTTYAYLYESEKGYEHLPFYYHILIGICCFIGVYLFVAIYYFLFGWPTNNPK